ncbi:EPB72-like 2 [Clavulina sp. PMI_390]|nr:EPB72-like 2 [Clavulina sp. PMI_390]
MSLIRQTPVALRHLAHQSTPRAATLAMALLSRPSLARFASTQRGATTSYHETSRPINFGINFVPTKQAYIIERFGKFHKILQPGLNFNIPVIDRIAYVQNMKEIPIEITPQTAITADNVGIQIDGVLYIKVIDPYKASYGVDDAVYAISQLAQTTMRSEIGSMTLDQSLKERAALNAKITVAVNEATEEWGVRVMRYEIRNINPPEAVIHSMHMQVSAERTKRAQILEAEGTKQSSILVSEARKIESVNVARGEAEAALVRADATAQALLTVGRAIQSEQGAGKDAVQLRVAEKWIEAFEKLAKEGNTLIIPQEVGNPSSAIAQVMGIFKGVNGSAVGDAGAKKAIEGSHASSSS